MYVIEYKSIIINCVLFVWGTSSNIWMWWRKDKRIYWILHIFIGNDIHMWKYAIALYNMRVRRAVWLVRIDTCKFWIITIVVSSIFSICEGLFTEIQRTKYIPYMRQFIISWTNEIIYQINSMQYVLLLTSSMQAGPQRNIRIFKSKCERWRVRLCDAATKLRNSLWNAANSSKRIVSRLSTFRSSTTR